MGLRKAWTLPVVPFTSARGPSNEFPGVAPSSPQLSGSGFALRFVHVIHLVSTPTPLAHPQSPLSESLAHLSSLRTVNPINKRVKKIH